MAAALAAGCVPVYYGGTDARTLAPESLFVDMRRFPGPDGRPDIGAVIAHCLAPGVYERHAAAVREQALDILLKRFSIESCLIEPLQTYLDGIQAEGWRSRRRSIIWRVYAARAGVAAARRRLLAQTEDSPASAAAPSDSGAP